LPFLRRLRCVVRVEKRGAHGPSRKQLDAVQLVSSYAISENAACVLAYKAFTSPWALDSWSMNKYLAPLAGPRLPKGKRFKPAAVSKPSQWMRLTGGNMPPQPGNAR
jgi:hypothetical protein